ncbi:DUF1638 domain-containing protein [Desulfoferrobacter suflitae]|uniref:DUF1638 domain-containing protein n=1 Tax=Desulfoferrobacter suflitae TaxID=2865782 RepID=UPI0021641AF0|nr:DUF1638 domain-containing protein [Desulfoferrobacter suflitae]MCK8600989.1 DUF1638 domain-containing protein [Desulfoferrobacter suflitae]
MQNGARFSVFSRNEERLAQQPSQTRIIACGVFQPALVHLRLTAKYKTLSISFLPSYLHMHPKRLKTQLLNRIIPAKMNRERLICLYGNCFAGFGEFCARYGVQRVAAAHCYELFLGGARFRQIVDAEAGSYFMERDLLVNFESYCLKPLELQDDEMRQFFFGKYKQLIYVRQPTDQDLLPRAKELADFLRLSLQVVEADYAELERKISELI